MSYVIVTINGELYHHGIKGQKWGVRRTHEELKYNAESVKIKINRIAKEIKAYNGLKITKMSKHSMDRINENRKDRKVSANDIKNALEKPLGIRDTVYDENNRPSIRYIGKKAVVNVNPETGVIATVWCTGSNPIDDVNKLVKKGGGQIVYKNTN